MQAIEIMGSNAELQEDLDDITTYLERQKKVFEKRDKELEAETDEDKLQVISCMKNLCLRGKATNI
jgi:CO dehydrogenase/acetyl-CoA synthase beta subunit